MQLRKLFSRSQVVSVPPPSLLPLPCESFRPTFDEVLPQFVLFLLPPASVTQSILGHLLWHLLGLLHHQALRESLLDGGALPLLLLPSVVNRFLLIPKLSFLLHFSRPLLGLFEQPTLVASRFRMLAM